jgi:hypothetical protein
MCVVPTVRGAYLNRQLNVTKYEDVYRLDQIINVLEKRTFGGRGNIHSVNIRFPEIKKFRKALKVSGELS